MQSFFSPICQALALLLCLKITGGSLIEACEACAVLLARTARLYHQAYPTPERFLAMSLSIGCYGKKYGQDNIATLT
jgi:hypothetical protein